MNPDSIWSCVWKDFQFRYASLRKFFLFIQCFEEPLTLRLLYFCYGRVFFNGCGADLSSRRLPLCWVLRENLSFFAHFLSFFPTFCLIKAAPAVSFWAKKALSFCPKGKNWVFFAVEFSRKCWKKSLLYGITRHCCNNFYLTLNSVYKKFVPRRSP